MLYGSKLQNGGVEVVDSMQVVYRYWLVAQGDCRCDVLTAFILATPTPP